jgi:peptide/nickel transport system substrate-binding protein
MNRAGRTAADLLRSIAFVIAAAGAAQAGAEELLTTSGKPGQYGGELILAERSQPKTLNPVTAIDGGSRQAIQLLMADLIHIDRESQRTVPALARSFEVSRDGRRYTVHLRRGVRFSDGHPFNADDVVFTFQVYLDEKIHSPQRDLLIVAGAPVAVRKEGDDSVSFEFAQPYAPGDRLFDSIAILPRHLLLRAYREGKLAQAWGLTAAASEIAGLGPFRFKEYVPGQRLVLERNPYYWKQDSAHNRLPYVQAVLFDYVGTEDAQVLRFETGASSVISRLGARNFDVLANNNRDGRQMQDLGAGLEYNFVFFNLNDLSKTNLPRVADKQTWFRDVNFRRAVSAAIDRDALARLVYAGRAAPIWTHVTPGNKLWVNTSLPKPRRSLDIARTLLKNAGFSWNQSGALVDKEGRAVTFSLITNTGNSERMQMAAMVQHDLEEIGISVRVATLEFRSMLDRVMNSFDYEACLLGLASGDVDPGSEMNLWLSTGSTHLWNLGQTTPATPWEAEIDKLMKAQMVSLQHGERKRLYDRVQQLVAEYLPIICLVSPNVLVGARAGVDNFRPAILPPYSLWNAEELFWRKRQ